MHYVRTFHCLNLDTQERNEFQFTEGNCSLYGAQWFGEQGVTYESALQMVDRWNSIAGVQNITRHLYWL